MRSKEREYFFKHLSDMYIQNPKLNISYSGVYDELIRFCICDDQECFVDRDSLVGVQVKLSNKYRQNNNVSISGDDAFWKIYFRNGYSDNEFKNVMHNGVKLYIAVDAKDLYRISSLVFDYMIKEKIVMHCKIPNFMRTDVLVCRIENMESANKVIEYVNSLNYKPIIKFSPFIYTERNVGIAMDGSSSYTNVLAKFLCEYLKMKKETNSLDNMCDSDFAMFIDNQISLLKSDEKEQYIKLYQIDGNEKYRDHIMIGSIIYKNLNESMSLDDLTQYANYKEVFTQDLDFIYFDSEEIKMKYVIYSMDAYYSVDEVHMRIMKFIETGDYTLFTRDGEKNIRAIMCNNFTPSDALKVISRIGWKALVEVSRITYNKNGYEQLATAICELYEGKGLLSFTNDGYVRSCLGLVIPPVLLKDVIINKLMEKNMEISSDSLFQLILEEIDTYDKKVNKSKCKC